MRVSHTTFDGAESYSPMQRVILTTSGNLQRVISAYYNSPVSVEILLNEYHPHDCSTSHRAVVLGLHTNTTAEHLLDHQGQKPAVPFGVALSAVQVTDENYLEFFRQHNPGLGQFFQHFKILPAYRMIMAGKDWRWDSKTAVDVLTNQLRLGDSISSQQSDWSDRCTAITVREFGNENIWRLYELVADGIECRILEVLRSDIFNLAVI